MVLGAHVVLCMTQPDLLKIIFYPQNVDNKPRSEFFEKVQGFFLSSCMLQQISYLGKFWFLIYGPKYSWSIRFRDFSISHSTLKLAVSHKEINETNCFLVCPSNSFLRNGSLGFTDFWLNGRYFEY